LSITPATFDWVTFRDKGTDYVIFDGATASSEYGYAAIKPKTTGDFYTGVQSSNGTWAGPFKFLDGGNNVRDNFISGEFMEFSVNLSKLGLDPVTMMGGSACGLPFRRILAKTRTSNSFSSELQDFIGPFDFFMTPRVSAAAEAPILCTTNGLSKINVVNPYATSLYTWYTEDGNIITRYDSTSIYVNSPGTYIVKQELMDGCGSYASDTVNIIYDANCVILDSKDIRLNASIKEGKPSLSWSSVINSNTKYYEIQRSIDGKAFETIGVVNNSEPGASQKAYSYKDETVPEDAIQVSYRVKAILKDGEFTSTSVLLKLPYSLKLSVYPNPAFQKVNLSILSEKPQKVEVAIVSAAGKTVYQQSHSVKKGANLLTLDRIGAWTPGMYIVRVSSITSVQWEKIIIQNTIL
jgi:hypothetical protein